jgi:hypothetical protein
MVLHGLTCAPVKQSKATLSNAESRRVGCPTNSAKSRLNRAVGSPERLTSEPLPKHPILYTPSRKLLKSCMVLTRAQQCLSLAFFNKRLSLGVMITALSAVFVFCS